MAGVILPDRSAAVINPAYAASGFEGAANSVPLPIGLINVVSRDVLLPGGESFDILPLIDQASYLNTLIFNLPSSPEEFVITVRNDGSGNPIYTVSEEGDLSLLGRTVGFGTAFTLPFHFAAGPVRVGVRPYLYTDMVASPDADLQNLLVSGASEGTLSLEAQAEAGIAVDVFYASKLPDALFEASDFEGEVYVGVRAAPFLGLARADGTARATVNGTVDDADFSYEGEGFVSVIGSGGFGFGLETDVGFATSVPLEDGTASFGLSLSNIGLGFWQGSSYTFTGDLESGFEDSVSAPTDDAKTLFSPHWGVHANGAYAFQAAPFLPMLVAADLSYQGGIKTHLGAEAVFAVAEGTGLAARAGIGYDRGFMVGLGTGLALADISIDLALTAHTAPFSDHQSFGLSASVGF